MPCVTKRADAVRRGRIRFLPARAGPARAHALSLTLDPAMMLASRPLSRTKCDAR